MYPTIHPFLFLPENKNLNISLESTSGYGKSPWIHAVFFILPIPSVSPSLLTSGPKFIHKLWGISWPFFLSVLGKLVMSSFPQIKLPREWLCHWEACKPVHFLPAFLPPLSTLGVLLTAIHPYKLHCPLLLENMQSHNLSLYSFIYNEHIS